MHRAWIAAPTLLIVGFAVPISPAWAESPGTAAAATAHALAEQANACAQKKPECFTPTATATSTVAPTPTATLVVPSVTPTVEPSATPAPGLPVPARGADPLGGYLRPSPGDPDVAGDWLELALPTGRWDVFVGGRGEGTCHDRLGDWSDVWLFTAGPNQPPAIADRDYFGDGTWGSCEVAQWFWHSDTPCAQDTETGLCSAEADPVLQALEASTVAQVLPAGGPPDDGLTTDAPTPAVLAPPPADPRNPGAVPQPPIVIMIVATPAPVPTLAPNYQQPVDPPTPIPATVIYVVVTPTPFPTDVVWWPTTAPTVVATPTEEPAQMRAPVVAEAPPPVVAEPRVPVDHDHMPPPMLISFGLLLTRRRVREQSAGWTVLVGVSEASRRWIAMNGPETGEETMCLPPPLR